MSTVTPEQSMPRDLMSALSVKHLAYGLIALHMTVRSWVVFPSYFFQDDFAHLDLARQGLSTDYLFRDYGGHLEPGAFFVYWLVSHVIEVSFWPAAVWILAMQLLASLLLYWTLRELFGDRATNLVPLTIYLFTPLSLAWVTWWAASLEALSLQIALLTVIFCMARLYRTGQRRWAVLSVAGHVVGLVFWEKSAVILPAALAVTILVMAPSVRPRRVIATLTRHWAVWVTHVAILAGYLGVYLSVVQAPGEGAGEGTVATLLEQTVLRTFVPGLFGGPWHAKGAENTLYPYVDTVPATIFAMVLGLLALASFKVAGAQAAKAWLLLGGYLAVDLALLGLGRGELLGLLSRDPRYVADGVVIACIALAAAFHVPDGAPGGSWTAIFRQYATQSNLVRVSAVLVLSCLITTFRLAPVAQHEYSYNFTMGVLRQMSEDPDRSVVATNAPYVVSARADVPQMMNAIGAKVEFNRPATQMYIFDGVATLLPMDLYPGASTERGPKRGCGWAVRSQWTRLGALPQGGGQSHVLRLGYYTGQGVNLGVRVGDHVQDLNIPAGTGLAYFVIREGGHDLEVSVTGGDGSCITEWSYGAAWVAQ